MLTLVRQSWSSWKRDKELAIVAFVALATGIACVTGIFTILLLKYLIPPNPMKFIVRSTLPRATLVIWMERSRLLCAWRAVTRVFRRGEAHRIDKLPEVLKFIWRFNAIHRPRIEAMRVCYAPDVPVCRMKTLGDSAAFLS
jgi:hypothetical protein